MQSFINSGQGVLSGNALLLDFMCVSKMTDLKNHENAPIPEVSLIGVVLHISKPPEDLQTLVHTAPAPLRTKHLQRGSQKDLHKSELPFLNFFTRKLQEYLTYFDQVSVGTKVLGKLFNDINKSTSETSQLTNNIDLACSNSTNWIQPYRKQADPNQTLGLLSVSTQSLCQVCFGGPELTPSRPREDLESRSNFKSRPFATER